MIEYDIVGVLKAFLESLNNGINAFEIYQGSVEYEKQYTRMQGIIHFIGWTLIIIIFVLVFKFMKKHVQQDERYKKYVNQNQTNENQPAGQQTTNSEGENK
jgi:anaerobic C4-dicarboxylate transporter